MTYLVSARRWRPQTFDDLVGQEHVARTLSNAIRAGKRGARLPLHRRARRRQDHRGAHPRQGAQLRARADPDAVQRLHELPVRSPPGTAVDVLEIDGASNTGVDDVREIIENVRYQAAKSRFKIYIIDEVHMLSNSAFNALLKTLEEPPPHVKFIFATTDPHKLPATIQSRCQRYDFRRIPLRQVVEPGCARSSTRTTVEISDRALFMLAREGEGSMRDAQSLLDQVLAGADGARRGRGGARHARAGRPRRHRGVGRCRDRSRSRRASLTPLDDAYQRGVDLRRFTRDLLEHFRNLAVAKVSNGTLLPDVADDEATALRAQAARIPAADCDRAFHVLLEADEEVARTPYPKLVLEMALLKLATLPAAAARRRPAAAALRPRGALARRWARAAILRGCGAVRRATRRRAAACAGDERRAAGRDRCRARLGGDDGGAIGGSLGGLSGVRPLARGRRSPITSGSARCASSTSAARPWRCRGGSVSTICRAATTCR